MFSFQQLVNENFPDRSTKASEARENQHKNRYPDIKAYDQTRIKLTPVDGVPGSDYINANFVLGYKELKKFICAQGMYVYYCILSTQLSDSTCSL